MSLCNASLSCRVFIYGIAYVLVQCISRQCTCIVSIYAFVQCCFILYTLLMFICCFCSCPHTVFLRRVCHFYLYSCTYILLHLVKCQCHFFYLCPCTKFCCFFFFLSHYHILSPVVFLYKVSLVCWYSFGIYIFCSFISLKCLLYYYILRITWNLYFSHACVCVCVCVCACVRVFPVWLLSVLVHSVCICTLVYVVALCVSGLHLTVTCG